ncbi:MAG: carboxypeptidase-like regulatory domain-containing protein [Acidobacteriota bacterium]
MKVHARWAAAVVGAILALGVGPRNLCLVSTASAQVPGQRTVAGVVVDANDKAVSGATVFLRNPKTKMIRSYTSAQDGQFRFAQVSTTDDFDLWAEKDGKKSDVKTVSSWDTRPVFHCELKIK